MLICHPYIFLDKVSVQIFCPFFNGIFFLIVEFESSLYMLAIILLSCIWSANIFSFCGLSFQFLTLPFVEQKLLVLMKFNFSFLDHAFDVLSKNSSPNPTSKIFSHIFSSKVLESYVLYLGAWTIMSFYTWCEGWVKVHIFFACEYSVLSEQLVGKTIFLPLNGFCTVAVNQLAILSSSFLIILSYSSFFLPPYSFDDLILKKS